MPITQVVQDFLHPPQLHSKLIHLSHSLVGMDKTALYELQSKLLKGGSIGIRYGRRIGVMKRYTIGV